MKKIETDQGLAEAVGCSRKTVALMKKNDGLRKGPAGYDVQKVKELLKARLQRGAVGSNRTQESRYFVFHWLVFLLIFF